MLTGELAPDSGTVEIAKTLTGVMIDQQRRLMAPDKTVRQVLAEGGDWIDVRGVRKHVQGYLKEFLFDPGLVDTKVGILSGGEKSRLLLAREFAKASNLLVLDEPTNDLDLETLDLLQEVIADYEGTVLIVSHDRDFLDRTVTLTLGLDGSGRVDVVAGGYEDWVAKRRAPASNRKQRRAKRRRRPRPPRRPPRPRQPSSATGTSAITSSSPPGSRNWTQRLRAGEQMLLRPRTLHPRPSEIRQSHQGPRKCARRKGRGGGALAGAGRDGRGVSERLAEEISACRVCAEHLPHGVRPVVSFSSTRAAADHRTGSRIESPRQRHPVGRCQRRPAARVDRADRDQMYDPAQGRAGTDGVLLSRQSQRRGQTAAPRMRALVASSGFSSCCRKTG